MHGQQQYYDYGVQTRKRVGQHEYKNEVNNTFLKEMVFGRKNQFFKNILDALFL